MVVEQRYGPLVLRNIAGDAFVQNLRGPIYIGDSSFDRLRTRTGVQNTIFQRCNVRQIEASSIRGSIYYDDGTFQPGLARFETVSGHVALGVNGGANIGVKGSPGQIYQSFDRPATVNDRNGEATASIGGGGPVVNVVTQQGRVYLYDGAMSEKRALPPPWEPVRAPLQRVEQELRAAVPTNAARRWPHQQEAPPFRRRQRTGAREPSLPGPAVGGRRKAAEPMKARAPLPARRRSPR